MAFRETQAAANREPLAKIMEVEGEIREFVRRDVVTNLGRQPEDESEGVASKINSVLQRVSATSMQEIDKLISELKTLRDRLQSEAARVQREIVEYASLAQGALQSTKIIAETLAQSRTDFSATALKAS